MLFLVGLRFLRKNTMANFRDEDDDDDEEDGSMQKQAFVFP